jgi:large subunit ribosomal protein L23
MSSTTKSPYEIIVKPIVTEKSVSLTPAGKYVFSVANDANKYEVAWAVEQIQIAQGNPVHVVAVNVLSVKGRERRGRYRRKYNKGTTSNWKKAIVTLQAGQSIQLVEGV